MVHQQRYQDFRIVEEHRFCQIFSSIYGSIPATFLKLQTHYHSACISNQKWWSYFHWLCTPAFSIFLSCRVHTSMPYWFTSLTICSFFVSSVSPLTLKLPTLNLLYCLMFLIPVPILSWSEIVWLLLIKSINFKL